MKTIAIGCDHVGIESKNKMIVLLRNQGYKVIDCGTSSLVSTHYPVYGLRVASAVVNDHASLGIVIGGTGVGITVAAAKVKGVRATLAGDPLTAEVARRQYDANVLGLGGHIVGFGLMEAIIHAFIATPFDPKHEANVLALNKLLPDGISKEQQFKSYLDRWEQGHFGGV
jgi:galactose-6-phosphate isomerase